MKNKICPKCDAIMIIDEWDGWIWTCLNCDAIGEKATDKEIREYEKNLNKQI